MANGYIYLFECVSNHDTSYKIGFTKNKNVNKRILNLQTGNKDKINCLYLFETNIGRKVETILHNMYSHRKIKNEWFNLEITDVASFISNCERVEKNLDALKDNHFFNK